MKKLFVLILFILSSLFATAQQTMVTSKNESFKWSNYYREWIPSNVTYDNIEVTLTKDKRIIVESESRSVFRIVDYLSYSEETYTQYGMIKLQCVDQDSKRCVVIILSESNIMTKVSVIYDDVKFVYYKYP